MSDSRQLARKISEAQERVELLEKLVKRSGTARTLVEDEDRQRYWELALDYEIDLREAIIELNQLEIALRQLWKEEGFDTAEQRLPLPQKD